MNTNTIKDAVITPAHMGDYVAHIPVDAISITAFVDMLGGSVLLADQIGFDDENDDLVTEYRVVMGWHRVPGLADLPLREVERFVNHYTYEALNI